MHRYLLYNGEIKETGDALLSPGQVGYMNGWELSIATDEIRADGTNTPHVYDYAANNGSYVATSNSIELMNANGSLSGNVFWGSEYIW